MSKVCLRMGILLMAGVLWGCDAPVSEEDNKDLKEPAIVESKTVEQKEKDIREEETKPNETDNIEKSLSVYLDIPQRIQETDYYCVPACVQMALQYFGITSEQSVLASEMKSSHITGTEYIDMARVLNQYIFDSSTGRKGGYDVQTLSVLESNPESRDLFYQRVKKNMDDGYPSFAAVDLHALYPELPKANHMVIITGYQLSIKGEVLSFTILDPYGKVQDPVYGASKTFPPGILWQAVIQNEEPAYLW